MNHLPVQKTMEERFDIQFPHCKCIDCKKDSVIEDRRSVFISFLKSEQSLLVRKILEKKQPMHDFQDWVKSAVSIEDIHAIMKEEELL